MDREDGMGDLYSTDWQTLSLSESRQMFYHRTKDRFTKINGLEELWK